MYASVVMHLPPDHIVPEEEKNAYLHILLAMGRARAIEYLENVKLNPLPLNFLCPKENIVCKTVEFDNIKIFYHLMRPNLRLEVNFWSFYLARPGASASECIDWAAEGIHIERYDNKLHGWMTCPEAVATPGGRVRILYTFQSERRVREIIFAGSDPSIPVLYLD